MRCVVLCLRCLFYRVGHTMCFSVFGLVCEFVGLILQAWCVEPRCVKQPQSEALTFVVLVREALRRIPNSLAKP